MNLILFTPDDFSTASRDAATLAKNDARAAHIIGVLRRKPGDTFDAGLVNGPRGKGTLSGIASDGAVSLAFAWDKTEPPPLPPVTLVIGLPRPQTARKILNEATALGVSEMHFAATARGEPSYAQSTLWTTGEYRRHLEAGAAQAFCTRIPRIEFLNTLDETLASLARDRPSARRVALDNYESPASLGECLAAPPKSPAILALGSERGWTADERDRLRAAHFAFAHLGPRVLRLETAVVSAVTLALAHMGRM
ncbi:16S rRNA (uracil1498-N3)-methyltransferase [Ereboglobus sp. PH5-10]|uniref:16S rRNA (uracil(1498)-N(3))-methyltransferase n=1 Tax=Ereboglobus sp. PH5-10 TaxID=2940629 RepID=UPI00240546AB|nr:RsmE family RNA methyltransferase [Ereboglobus sp. PH5-10]MDF9826158.1 16S rRNA (uracil1498-N3)-methyltransferase [Ereboglobus sp. PH5-10]